nr:MAG TPA: hypothetical protein [Crassvirales sp.]DAP79170.1 MAG TPA: hypothetical protein [Caudoviricetes sp.]DAQ45777.1 MAG TPA: hypothetical protein [Caudoviricetes sp.]DAR45769.1 MAG TPA: hypothetical protein [Bacteriophage sp.]DAV84187.1 MAG TPA: hypothetical protein [Caudoviricetes sp.]
MLSCISDLSFTDSIPNALFYQKYSLLNIPFILVISPY